MSLLVSEFMPSVQSTGSMAGSPAILLTLSGCNMWSGKEDEREFGIGECARWCDARFTEAQKCNIYDLCHNIVSLTESWETPMVVFTGGEPLLQFMTPGSEEVLRILKANGVFLSLETNGTLICDALKYFDHITVSPKRKIDNPNSMKHIVLRTGTDLKVVAPQWELSQLREMDDWDFDYRYILPCDPGEAGGMYESTIRGIALAQTLGWRVSIQTNKLIGLP